MAATLTAIVSSLKYLAYRNDDDYIDRMHYFFTSNLLISLSVLCSFKQFGGSPMECMLPDYFPRSWEQYAENYCWAQDTYYLSFDVDLTRQTPRDRKISYYQWVPFFLLIEACCFRLPSLVWKYLAAHSGIRIHDIVKLAVDERNIQSDVKTTNVQALTTHLQNALRFHRRLLRKNIRPHKVVRILNLPYSAVYVTFTYLVTKLLYLINVWAQLLLMNKFLQTDKYSWYGWGALSDLLSGVEWKTSGTFPRVTLCDFQVRGMGNLQDYSVQCVLVINIFNEKIFIFLWFWYMALMIMTTISFIYWFTVMVLPWPSRWFISRHLELSEMPFDPKGSAKDVERFVASYLKTDGVFVLRMITMHSGIIFGTDLVLSLWRSFYGIEERVKRGDSYMTPTPTTEDEAKASKLRLRQLKQDQKTVLGVKNTLKGKKVKAKVIDDEDEDEAANDDTQGVREVLLKGPGKRLTTASAPVVSGLDQPDSKATTLEAAARKPAVPKKPKEIRLKMTQDSDEEDDDEEEDIVVVKQKPKKGAQVNILPAASPTDATSKRSSV